MSRRTPYLWELEVEEERETRDRIKNLKEACAEKDRQIQWVQKWFKSPYLEHGSTKMQIIG